MRVTVLPASSQAGAATVQALLSHPSGPTVRAVYRDTAKAPADVRDNPRFEAVQGDVGAGGLDFGDSEAVYYVAPVAHDGQDVEEWGRQTAGHVKEAIERAGGHVKRLVLQSALGANYKGVGTLRLNTVTDDLLKDAAPRTFIIRPCTYYDNWKAALKSVQDGETSFDSYISPADFAVPMVSLRDVAAHSTSLLLDSSSAQSTATKKIFGPKLYSSNDVRDAIAAVTGKQDVKVRSVPRDELHEWFGKIVAPGSVQDYVDFATCQDPGGELAKNEYKYGEDTIRGETELVDELRRYL